MLPAVCVSRPFMLDEDGMSAVTMWIAGDFETEPGRRLLLSALKHVVSIIFSVLPPPTHPPTFFDFTFSSHSDLKLGVHVVLIVLCKTEVQASQFSFL